MYDVIISQNIQLNNSQQKLHNNFFRQEENSRPIKMLPLLSFKT